jgi:hypothetical protein
MNEPSAGSRPTPKMVRLYHELSRRLGGEPEDLWVFDPADLADPSPRLRLTHVMAWPADDDCDVTSFNTLGMSDRRMTGADYFAELHFGWRSRLGKDERLRVARFLANVAQYPFDHDLKLDWWEVIKRPGSILPFSGCRHVLLHPRFAKDGLDQLDDPDGPVKLLWVVPITPLERHLLVDHGRAAFVSHVQENHIDLFADRQDPEGVGPFDD